MLLAVGLAIRRGVDDGGGVSAAAVLRVRVHRPVDVVPLPRVPHRGPVELVDAHRRAIDRGRGRERDMDGPRICLGGRARRARRRARRAAVLRTAAPAAVRRRRPALLARGGRSLSARRVSDVPRRGDPRVRADAPRARSRAARAARANRSALHLQQPALDQRADHDRCRGRANDVPAARRFSPRHAASRLEQPHFVCR